MYSNYGIRSHVHLKSFVVSMENCYVHRGEFIFIYATVCDRSYLFVMLKCLNHVQIKYIHFECIVFMLTVTCPALILYLHI